MTTPYIPKKRGSTTVVTGTNGILTDAPAGLILRSAKYSNVVENVEEPGNSGRTGVTIDWDNGFDCEVTVLEDTGAPAPALFDVLNIVHPESGTTVKGDVFKGGRNRDRKQPGEVSFTVRYRPDRDAGTVSWP